MSYFERGIYFGVVSRYYQCSVEGLMHAKCTNCVFINVTFELTAAKHEITDYIVKIYNSAYFQSYGSYCLGDRVKAALKC